MNFVECHVYLIDDTLAFKREKYILPGAMAALKYYCDICVLPACQLVVCDLEGAIRTSENMALSDGLLLQVNNGEQWTNRWKHPNDDSVRHTDRCISLMLLYTGLSITHLVSVFNL